MNVHLFFLCKSDIQSEINYQIRVDLHLFTVIKNHSHLVRTTLKLIVFGDLDNDLSAMLTTHFLLPLIDVIYRFVLFKFVMPYNTLISFAFKTGTLDNSI